MKDVAASVRPRLLQPVVSDRHSAHLTEGLTAALILPPR
jgi:hypothetical protein